MLHRLILIGSLLGASVLRAEDDSFTRSLTPAEFAAAGLDKLTPEQRAKLDALVHARQNGAVAKATEETTKVVTATVRDETTKAVTETVRAETTKAVAEAVRAQTTQEVTEAVRAQTAKQVAAEVRQQVEAEDKKAAEKKAASAGFLDRMKVVLKPGTEIEYTTLDATLAYNFHGWEKGTRLTLTNGQRWEVTDDDHYWAPASDKPVHVRIVPGILGSFFMEIEHGGRPRVKFIGHVAAPSPTPTP
jgi:hypothetical protein